MAFDGVAGFRKTSSLTILEISIVMHYSKSLLRNGTATNFLR